MTPLRSLKSVATTSWIASKSRNVTRLTQMAIILRLLKALRYWSSRADNGEPIIGYRLLFLRH